MATDRDRVTAYLPSNLAECLQQYQTENELGSISAAIVAALQEFFEGGSSPRDNDRLDRVEQQLTELAERLGKLSAPPLPRT